MTDANAVRKAATGSRVIDSTANMQTPATNEEGAREVDGATIAAHLVSVTTRDWAQYATGSVRDSFLASLEEKDLVHAIAIARHLVTCGNPLPSATCAALGLPPGSSYGAGAQAVLTKADQNS